MVKIDEDLIQPTHRPLLAFNNYEVRPMSKITLHVYTTERVVMVTFMVVNISSPINIIMGR